MKQYKIGNKIEVDGKCLTIYDLCRGCRTVWAEDEDGLRHMFKYRDGRLVLVRVQNESKASKVVRELLYEVFK